MNDTKHTPGPWKPRRAHEDYEGPYFDIDPEDTADYAARPFVKIEAANGETVAAAHDLFEFKAADAHLIAAAPELYEALAGTLDWLASYPGFGSEQAWLKAHAALAKVKGIDR